MCVARVLPASTPKNIHDTMYGSHQGEVPDNIVPDCDFPCPGFKLRASVLIS